MRKILFVSWDGPQTSYMDGLFMPIFQEITKKYPVEFHVVQFTWGNRNRTLITETAAKGMNIYYQALPILKGPVSSFGSLITLFSSSKKIESYIKHNNIDIVMPRSNFPAFMVNQIKDRSFKVIYDADGLPIEERVEFSGLKKGGWQYRWLKSIEKKTLLEANHVITRSEKSINIHLKNIGDSFKDKFSVVYNGRDTQFFASNEEKRKVVREQLGILGNEILMIYCGSLGPQYGWDEMLNIFKIYSEKNNASWLILTGNTQFAEARIPNELKEKIIVRNAPFQQVPDYLNAADIGFAIRQPTFSMQGVAPIKLGEYLLMGIPVIASKGIGDTDEIMKDFPECFIYNHDLGMEQQAMKIQNWLKAVNNTNREDIKNTAKKYFSLEAAAHSYIKVIKQIYNYDDK